MGEPVDPILMTLAGVLEPLGDERRAPLLEWVKEEIETRAIITDCADEEHLWSLGEPDPLVPDGGIPRIVFAMLEWHALRAIVVFSFSELEVDGQHAVQFHRNVVWNPKRTTGPLGHEALFRELRGLLDKDPEELPEAAE